MIALALTMLTAAGPQPYDLVFTHARVVDGTGAPWFRADVAVRGDRIVAVGDLSKAAAAKTIDLHDQVLAPGFIDMLGQSDTAVLIDNRLESKLRQGFTTELNGEGESSFPLDDRMKKEAAAYLERFHLALDWNDLAGYRKRFEKNKSTMNFAMLVGAGSIRAHVVGFGDVEPDAKQLAAMEAEVQKAMDQGAFGLGTSLIYPPDRFAKTPELIALAQVAARNGGFYASHMRSEADDEDAAVDEAIAIGREAKLPVEIWHLKCAGKNNQGKMKALLERLEKARESGVDVSANVYPYDAAMNGLESSLPAWAEEGGNDAMLSRLKDPEARKKMLDGLFHTKGMGLETPEGILLTASPAADAQPFTGMRLSEAAKKLNKPAAEALLDLVGFSRGNFMVVRFVMSEDDVKLALQKSWVSLDTDMWGQATDGPYAKELAHPRAFGTTPRLLGHYVRELHLLTLEDAVRKMTSLPARRLGLGDRGLLRPGMMADLVAFDPATVRETATFEKPLSYPEGISHVVVNGKLVLDSGKLTAERPGRLLWHGKN